MKVEIENFQTGWYGITLGVNENDIDRLIELLTYLKNNTDQHFHISSDYEGDGGVGDIEIYVQNEDEPDNMNIQF